MWDQADGQIRWHPDEAVTGVLTAVFERFAVCGSVRGVWLWLRDQGLKFPLQRPGYVSGGKQITWVAPTYHAVHSVLTHPAYAGAYVFGRTGARRSLDADGQLRVSRHALPQDQWQVLITGHHHGFIDWDTYQANQIRIRANIRPTAHQPGTGAVREGCALLQGLATCGTCGRKLTVYYDGPAKSAPGYYCTGTGKLIEGKDTRHLRVGGTGIDATVADAFLAALQPTALQACLAAAQQLEDGHHTALDQWRRQVEQARYQASQAERRYRAVDPDNRLVARGLETEWNTALQALADAEAELTRRQGARPKTLTTQEKSAVLALGDDLPSVWGAPTTTDKDRKRLLRSLLDEVNITVHRDHTDAHAELVLRWKGGAVTDLRVTVKRKPPNGLRTNEDTVDLVRRLAAHYPDNATTYQAHGSVEHNPNTCGSRMLKPCAATATSPAGPRAPTVDRRVAPNKHRTETEQPGCAIHTGGSACMLVDTWSSFAPRGAWFMVRVRGKVRPPAGGIDPGLHTLIWALDDEHSIAADLVDVGVAVTVCDAAVRREGNRECHTGSLP